MEHLAWQLLENKKDIVAAEKVFAALANRARLRSSSTSISEKDFEAISTHKMVSAILTLFFNENLSSTTSSLLTPEQSKSLAAAVLEPRIPSFVLFGSPESDEELAKAYRVIQLFVHPDKGHVKTTEAFVKLAERRIECLDQLREYQKYRQEEEKKEKEREAVMKQFADAVTHQQHQQGSPYFVFPSMSSPSSSLMNAVPFSSIPTGQNMFTIHQQQTATKRNHQLPTSPTSPLSNSTSAFSSPGNSMSLGGELNNTNNHDTIANSIDDETTANVNNMMMSSGSYHLPPLQARKNVHLNNNNSGSPHRSSSNHHSSSNTPTTTKSTMHHHQVPSSSPSFASPTRKPNPLDRSGILHSRPPSASSLSAAANRIISGNNKNNKSKNNSKFLDFASSPRRAGVATFSPHEKNKQKMKEKEFDSLMKQLRQQKHQTGAQMNGSFNKFLGDLQHDQMEQHEQEILLHSPTTTAKNEDKTTFHQNTKSKDSDSMIELTMKALLSKLKTQNSNVKLTCSLSSSHSTASPPSLENTSLSDMKQEEQESRDKEENFHHHRQQKPTENCRDFVVHRLGQVLQGHIRSLGDDIFDVNNHPEDFLVNRRKEGQDDDEDECSTSDDDGDGKDFKVCGSKVVSVGRRNSAIPSPPSSNRKNSTTMMMNHQGVGVVNNNNNNTPPKTKTEKNSGIHASFSPRRPSLSSSSNLLTSSGRRR